MAFCIVPKFDGIRNLRTSQNTFPKMEFHWKMQKNIWQHLQMTLEQKEKINNTCYTKYKVCGCLCVSLRSIHVVRGGSQRCQRRENVVKQSSHGNTDFFFCFCFFILYNSTRFDIFAEDLIFFVRIFLHGQIGFACAEMQWRKKHLKSRGSF